jgi:hypothetical protein
MDSKKMLVMPNGVRTYALLVDKIRTLSNVGNFRNPGHWNAQQGRYRILNEQSGVHLFGNLTVNHEAQFVGGYLGEVLGGRKKGPGFLERNGKRLGSLNTVHAHLTKATD